ncbi:swt1 RNA endoribonuclease [Osmia lignaria lignaria]|uniref:swt1 RNA endoribonuclease n=1 Tax=Osmia lignaria lignaria TaxID=1437193 RepID=UPI00402B0CD0
MMKQKLPKNWIVLASKTHPDRVYYFNVKTNQSSWEKPMEDQPKQVTKKIEPAKKRKKVTHESDAEIRPTTPEYDASEKEIGERKKLTAKRSLRRTQAKVNEEKVNEPKDNKEKDTPQMQILREKILKKKETGSPKSSKDDTKSLATKSDRNSPVHETEIDSTSNTVYTPQMKALLEKMQERGSKSVSNTKKVKENKDSDIKSKEEKPVTKLRQLKSKGRKEIGKKAKEECDSVEATPTRQSLKPMKKNLGKERMEKLKKNLAATITDGKNLGSSCVSIISSAIHKQRRYTNICKNAEVRLTRLKDKLSKDATSSNKEDHHSSSPQNKKCMEPKETLEPVSSVTVVDELVSRSNRDALYEEMDWEPLEDEKISHEVQAVRTQLCTENSTNTSYNIPSNMLKYPLLVEQQEKRQVYIVVDTNVFLSNIEIIDLVQETTLKTYDRSLIVIPWTVIRELDYIKDDHGKTKPALLCYKARKAVNYINKLFSSKNPRVIGQTPEDVVKNKEKFSVDCPDDEILQTCLQIRDLGKSVVLLSYDINLCTKAMIHDIVTIGRNDPLEKIDYLNATNYFNGPSKSVNQDRERLGLGSTSILSTKLFIADEMIEDTKSVMRDFLTVIVSKEMHTLYGDSWEKYVIVKPPWTIVTVLQCAIKHWIAAVSESFIRRAEADLKELLQIFKDTSGKKSLKQVIFILNKCSDLVQMVHVDKYHDLMSRVSKKVNELLQKCYDYELQINDQKVRDEIGVENDVKEQERRAVKAFRYFEAAYVYARDMCGLAAEVVGMPCTFHYNTPDPVPAVDYVKQIQPELAANVNRLLCNLSAVIEQVKTSRIDYRTLNNLHETLVSFLPEAMPSKLKLNDDLAPLDVYCCVKLKEEVLKTGLRQLQELSTHFCRFASYRCT